MWPDVRCPPGRWIARHSGRVIDPSPRSSRFRVETPHDPLDFFRSPVPGNPFTMPPWRGGGSMGAWCGTKGPSVRRAGYFGQTCGAPAAEVE